MQNSFMRSLFAVFILCLLQGKAMAVPNDYMGTYKFTGLLSVVSTKSTQIVQALNEQGRAVLKQLQNSGYTCQVGSRSYLYSCSKFIKANLSPSGSDSLKQKYVNLSLEFSSPLGGFEQTNDSLYLKEWERPQKVLFGEQVFYKITHLEGQNFVKLRLANADESEKQWLNVFNDNSTYEIRYPVFMTEKQAPTDKNISDSRETFLVELLLTLDKK